MEIIKLENVSFAYPEKENNALENINLAINQGEFVLICGKSGCGKTTLLRLLKPALAPTGRVCGKIQFHGKALSEYDERSQASAIGFVMQNPDNQIVTDKVWHELAFGLESLGLKQNEIRTRVSEMASFFGIGSWFYKKTDQLSGGQKQLLNLASIMVMQPEILILDEPASQLDPVAATEFLQTLVKINKELGTTIILTEHRLEDTFSVADKVVVMDKGRIIAQDVPERVGIILKNKNQDMYNALPTPMRVHSEVVNAKPCPITVKEGRMWLEEYAEEHSLNPGIIPKDAPGISEKTVIEVKDAWFKYEKNSDDVLKGFNLQVKKGELFALVGGNGTGKTTALSLISGINKPYRGDILINGQSICKNKNLYNGLLGVLPQNPQCLFVKNSVHLDLTEILSGKTITETEKEQRIQNVAKLCRIDHLLCFHPYDLSGGEQQRAALAKVLLLEPEIMLLDEPTKGMDVAFKEEFAHILEELKSKGVTILMVSHDIEFCAKYADRCALVFDGSITSEGGPREFFKGKSFYTTAANRMARNCLPDAVLAEDIILACGKKPKTDKKKSVEEYGSKATKQPEYKKKEELRIKQLPKKKSNIRNTLFTLFLILILIPVTIYGGARFFGGKKYYFTSLLVILEMMIPAFFAFESRKPKARELVLISVLCAIAVAGRTAFAGFSQFKPTLALVIISGVCLGREAGFLVGVITGFVSNFFFGQGPWTPWQMFALGFIGFLAGAVFETGFVKKTKTGLCIFGFLTALVVYGGIMNPASVIMWQSKITSEMIISACIAGISMDIVHAVATSFFLWFISKPMIEKIERIKQKFGMFENYSD